MTLCGIILKNHMPKKTITIFISVFVIVGLLLFGATKWINRNKTSTTSGNTPWYQSFNPFGTIGTTTNITDPNNPEGNQGNKPGVINSQTSRFFQITDFAVAGATFLEDTRPITEESADSAVPLEPIKTIIPANTKEGRKEIQIILNETLSLKQPLAVNGIFGKLAIQAIKDFQKLNNIPITGVVDIITAPYFTKTTQPAVTNKPQFEQVPSIRYVERMNGHIYKMFLDTKNKEKISNSTIPSIYEAFFDNTAQTVIYRYLSAEKTISSFMATLGAPKGDFLPQDISDLSTSLDKTKFFYLKENNDGVIGTVGTFGQTKKDIVFNSPFTEWLSQWDINKNIYLTTKPSYSVNGSMFLLNTSNKTTSKVLGGIPGLTTLISPDGSFVLYNSSTDTGPRLGVFNINKHTSIDLNTYGLPEKCTWSSNNINIYCAVPNVITGNQYPDYWYQGLISFDDYFVKIDTTTGEKVTLANSTDETPIDATYLFLNRDEDSLFFINKKDSTLWGMNL